RRVSAQRVLPHHPGGQNKVDVRAGLPAGQVRAARTGQSDPDDPVRYRVAFRDGEELVEFGGHPPARSLIDAASRGEGSRAFAKKTSSRSAAVSDSIPSMTGRRSSSARPDSGSLTEAAPGISVPNRHRSAPTIANSSASDSLL